MCYSHDRATRVDVSMSFSYFGVETIRQYWRLNICVPKGSSCLCALKGSITEQQVV
jgi:hypothetical protein